MAQNEVLIAEGEDPISLTIVRSLAAQNLKPSIMSNFPRCLSSSSKHTKRQILVPSMANKKEFAKAVEKIVRRIKFDVLFPLFEWSLIPISENRDQISSYTKLPIASHQSILKCYDKSSTLKLALENDVPIPRTCFVQNLTQLKRVSEQITYPSVVKPRSSVVWASNEAFTRRASYVNSAGELIASFKNIHQHFPFPLIQEYVPGTNYSFAALCKDGRPKSFCCIKVQRAWPPSGGNSCFRETVPVEPKIEEYAKKMLKALDWYGIAEVEFRIDSRDNIPRLMEINPRFWGSLSVAVKAGVDFPYSLYRLAMDGDVKGASSYKVGVKGRFLQQDLMYIFSVLGRSLTRTNIGTRNRSRDLFSWLKFYEPGIFYDLFDMSDPLPFIRNSAGTVIGLLKLFQSREPPGNYTEIRS